MENLIIVDNPRTCALDIAGAQVVSARNYLTDPVYRRTTRLRVFNLCKSYRYHSLGYYASLLADARGHKPLPSANTVKDMHSRNLMRYLVEDIGESVQQEFAPLQTKEVDLKVYFGRAVPESHQQLGRELFDTLRMPLLHASFERRGDRWHMRRVEPMSAADIPAEHTAVFSHAAAEYFAGRRPLGPRQEGLAYSLAILHDPIRPAQASNAEALARFETVAAELGMHTERITSADFSRLPEFDALFIRATTFVDHYTYRFSRRAAAEGLVVIDDPQSIVRCNNKVYVAELLARHHIGTPQTLLVHKKNTERIVPALGLPCVLKQPDSSFSQGVEKVTTEAELKTKVEALLQKSELVIAQEYLPTEFDWRIGVLERQPLFAAKYFMVPGHWQVIKHGARPEQMVEGAVQAVAIEEVPKAVVDIAVRVSGLIGDGLYGVDIKQVGGRFAVIEVNDNPNIDAGNEDAIAGDDVYRRIMSTFVKRIRAQRLRMSQVHKHG